MKLTWLLSLVVVGTSSIFVGGHDLDTCEHQAECVDFKIISMADKGVNYCENDSIKCEFEVCIRISHHEADGDFSKCHSPIRHICEKENLICNNRDGMRNRTGFPLEVKGKPFAKKHENIWSEYVECQIVGPNELVEFLVMDGVGCNDGGKAKAPVKYSLSNNFKFPDREAHCEPRTEETASCTDESVESECRWYLYSPDCPETANPDVTPTYEPTVKTDEPTDEPTEPTEPTTSVPTITPSKKPTKAPETKAPSAPETKAPSAPETKAPSKTPDTKKPTTGTSSPTSPTTIVTGDPHFKTWTGEAYDFHGICDLVLLRNPGFENGLGMDIHVRSKKIMQWSYISTAAIRIGKTETFEVAAGKDKNAYWINGVQGEKLYGLGSSMTLKQTVAGFPIFFTRLNKDQHLFEVGLGRQTKVVFKIWKDFVRVDVVGAMSDPENFQGSDGLVGTFPRGLKMARDKVTKIEDPNNYGQEWQVRQNEPKLFHNIEGPQQPESCDIPTKSALRRRLSVSSISLPDADDACSHVHGDDRELCIFDVMATSDKEVANAYN